MDKTCGTCKQVKPVSEFYKNKTKPDGLASYCKTCKRTYNKTHYTERGHLWKEVRAKQRVANKQKCFEWLFEFLMAHPCVDCGEDNILLLEFDHLRNKEQVVSKIDSIPRLRLEIEKCEVRCVRCHRLKTIERMGGNWKTKMLEQRASKVLK
jgi:hypothetical protein